MAKLAFFLTEPQVECMRAIDAGTFDSRTVAALTEAELIKQNGSGPVLTDRGRIALSLVTPPPPPRERPRWWVRFVTARGARS